MYVYDDVTYVDTYVYDDVTYVDTEVEEAAVVGLVRVAHHERHIIKCFMSHHQMHDVTSSNA